MMACFKSKSHKDEEKFFNWHGGILLEELIALRDGRSNIPLLHFSASELRRSTNNYQALLLSDWYYDLYQGYLNDRPILVKKYEYVPRSYLLPYKDIAIGSEMSVHKNVLKLIGYCLWTEAPIVVYEFCGTTKFLDECISCNASLLSWKCRLKITVDLANAIAYLHTAFPRPIVFGDIRSLNIILDDNNVAKLLNFDLCISIPKGESHVQDDLWIQHDLCIGYLAPEYQHNGYITEKTDVYSFGALLLEFLSGQTAGEYIHKYKRWLNPCVEELSNVVDHNITDQGIKVEQLLDFVTLASRCLSDDEENRPTMTDAGKELRRIYHITFPST